MVLDLWSLILSFMMIYLFSCLVVDFFFFFFIPVFKQFMNLKYANNKGNEFLMTFMVDLAIVKVFCHL